MRHGGKAVQRREVTPRLVATDLKVLRRCDVRAQIVIPLMRGVEKGQ